MNSILVIPKSGVESASVTDSEECMFFFFFAECANLGTLGTS